MKLGEQSVEYDKSKEKIFGGEVGIWRDRSHGLHSGCSEEIGFNRNYVDKKIGLVDSTRGNSAAHMDNYMGDDGGFG